MSKYVITKTVTGLDGTGSPDLLVNAVFKDRITAIAYVRMYIEKNGYKVTLGEYDFQVTGNIIAMNDKDKGILSEEYQLVELMDDYSSEYDKIIKEVEEWTLNLLGRKINN